MKPNAKVSGAAGVGLNEWLDPNKGMKNGNKTHTGAVDTAPNSAPSSGAFYWHSRHWAAPNLHGWNNERQPG
jgi:hypothetical protein